MPCRGQEESLEPSVSQDIQRHRLQETTWKTITYDDFEKGWGSFIDGGSDAARVYDKQHKHIHQGKAALRIRDNSSSSTVSQRKNNDVTSYSDLRVSFWFIPRGMGVGESFVFEYSSNKGKTWTLVKRWVVDGTVYRNERFYQEVVNFNKVTDLKYNLTTRARLRFRCDGKDNRHYIYIPR